MVFIRLGFARVTYGKIYAEKIDTLAGNMEFLRLGASKFYLSTDFVAYGTDIKIQAAQKIRDGDDSTLLDGDGSGNIQTLAPLTGAIKTGASAFKVTGRPALLASEGQTGTLTEANGKWVAAAGDYLYLWLDALIPQLALLAGVKIVSLEVVYDTGHNDDYITQVILGHYKNTQPNETVFSSDWSDTTDKGNGDTTADTAEYTPNVTLTVERSYQLQIQAVVPQTSVTVFAINLEYELV